MTDQQQLPPGWTQPAGAPYPIPSGWPGSAPSSRMGEPRDPVIPDCRPGPFVWRDLLAVLGYVLLFLLGLGALMLFIPGFVSFSAWLVGTDPVSVEDLARGVFPVEIGFAVNLINYLIMTVLVLIAAGPTLLSSLRSFRRLWPLKLLMIPAIWFGTIIINLVVTVLIGEVPSSENQLVLEEMTTVAPFWLMFVTVVICGPLVEEYIFRHLLIGKLSRWVTVWVSVPISVITFSLLHFIGAGQFNIIETIPYAVMGLAFSLVYTLMKFSLAFSYVQHAFNNAVAVCLLYLTPAELLEQGREQLGAAWWFTIAPWAGLV